MKGKMFSDYDDNDDYMYDDDDDDYLSMQARFDNVDLPPGVEASVSWLNDPTSSTNTPVSTSISTTSDAVGQLAGTGMSSSKFYNPASIKKGTDVISHSMMLAESSSAGREQEEKEDEVMIKFQLFKRFDTVDDFSDHHFSRMGISGQQPPKSWTKKVQDDWKILEKDLPGLNYLILFLSLKETLVYMFNFVWKTCLFLSTSLDGFFLRAVIVGPAGTPYHDGLFVFDVHFPPTYPDIPPMVYYYSGGLRLNPNLYDCGKVCLSLLNTWSGNKNEMWMPKTSTMLQVLVSIQALILNTNPFFNEPGYAEMYRGQDGERRSKAYNEDVFIFSLKTMMYTLRRPPKHFEDFVAGHFRLRGHSILSACRAYMEGAEVGSANRERAPDASGNNPMEFKAAVGRMMRSLVTNFIKNGSEDCEQFRTTA
ncbi:ubiquitin-conjugating enzyme 25 [Actinidia rufa]|uniref:Ubiquitin-conjugating enzyme 25 n=1 Tax=Actinidia rufa TaxID=165716 RepID=A0A7J0DT77_9ERIC|nr:ubiquitin-conjugating enzyme 25 [Actinidia rufa]